MPTDVVLDASAAGKLFRIERHSTALRSFVREVVKSGAALRVPPIFAHEVLNLVVKTLREGTFGTSDEAWSAYEAVLALVDESGVAARAQFDEAARSGLTVYDAAYVRLAGKRIRLVTYDRRQAAAAPKTASPV